MYCQFPGASAGYLEECLTMLYPSLKVPEMVDVACQLARAGSEGQQGRERNRYCNLAMNALRRARANGFHDLERLQSKDFEGLRSRKDFQKLVSEMQASSGK